MCVSGYDCLRQNSLYFTFFSGHLTIRRYIIRDTDSTVKLAMKYGGIESVSGRDRWTRKIQRESGRGEFQNTVPFHLEVGYFSILASDTAKDLSSLRPEHKLSRSSLYLCCLCNAIGVMSYSRL